MWPVGVQQQNICNILPVGTILVQQEYLAVLQVVHLAIYHILLVPLQHFMQRHVMMIRMVGFGFVNVAQENLVVIQE